MTVMTKIVLALLALLAIVTAGGAALVYKYKGDAEAERGRRVVAEINLLAAVKDNEKLASHITGMEEQARVNNEIVLDLANSVATLRAEQLETTRERGNLKAENEDVKGYLDACVPEPLRRVLDKRVGSKNPPPARCARSNPVEPAKGL